MGQDRRMEQRHHIGWAILQVILARDIEQIRLAEILDKDPATIHRWLKQGKPIGSTDVQIIADYIGMKVSDLYKIAETGIYQETSVDLRKQRLKALIDKLDNHQLDTLFPEHDVDPERKVPKTASA